MQFSIAKLTFWITAAAALFATIRSFESVGWMCLPVGMVLLFAAFVAYPIAILLSPQIGNRLDPSSNPFLPTIHRMAGLGLFFIVLFIVCIALSAYRYISF